MDLCFLINVLSRIFHVGTAICLAGGTVYTLFVLLPALRSMDETAKANLATAVTRYWKRFVHAGTALLLLTGFYNYFQQMKLHSGDGLYHALMGIKMLLAFAVFFLAAVLVGKSLAFESMRKNRSRYLSLIVLFLVVIVSISSVLKVRGVALKPDAKTTAIESQSDPSP